MANANATSNMLEPQVFHAMVEALKPSRGLKLYNSVPKESTPFPYYQWPVKHGRFSEMAELNIPNSEANTVPKQAGDSSASAALAYIREGDRFTPTATMLMRDIEAGYGNGNPGAILSAEGMIADKVAEVNDRINNRIEWLLWQALQGSMTYTGSIGTLTVDYHFDTTHKITLDATDSWDTVDGTGPTLASIIKTITNTKTLIRHDSGVDVTEILLTRPTMELLIKAWTDSAVSDTYRAILPDAMINQWFATGTLPNFMGVNQWTIVDQNYDVRSADGQSVVTHSYIPHGTVIFANMTANKPLKYVVGPSMDFDAPRNHIGRFAKNWTEKDPSGYAFLIEEMGLPILDRPDQFATVKVAVDTWVNAQTW